MASCDKNSIVLSCNARILPESIWLAGFTYKPSGFGFVLNRPQ